MRQSKYSTKAMCPQNFHNFKINFLGKFPLVGTLI